MTDEPTRRGDDVQLDVDELAELLAGALLGDDDLRLELMIHVDGRTVPVRGATYDGTTQTLTVHGGARYRPELRWLRGDDDPRNVWPTGLDRPPRPDPLRRRR